jgi:hypothetical protein
VDPSAVIDTMNNKLLIVTQDQQNGSVPAIFACRLDGSNCAFSDILAPNENGRSGRTPFALVDTQNSKLLVVTEDDGHDPPATPALFRCGLDGSGCTYIDISAGQPANSGATPTAVFNAAHNALLVVTEDFAHGGVPAVFRCGLDGSHCTYIGFSGGASLGQQLDTVVRPSAVIDPATGKLLVVAVNSSYQPSLLTSCGAL